ncbi:MAG: ATP-binding protein [Calditrichaeota bacterium]|nr:ATP-binding protein [Calditrichota bacterium]
MIRRTLENRVVESLQRFPIVGIIGARQVGKTTLAKKLQTRVPRSIYLDLELPSDLIKLQEPELYLRQHADKLVILDEIQRMPELFSLLRSLVDQDRRPGRFLLLGSSSPKVIKDAAESLAGRIVYHELSPFLLEEIASGEPQKDFQKLWLRGGFPESFLSPDETTSFQWREAFIRSFLERDLPLMGIRIPPLRIHRFWTMLAHYHGQLFNASQLSNALDLSSVTVKNYLEILHQAFIVRVLLPFHANVKKRLVKTPKMYFRDTGLLHSLLNIRSFEELQSHPIVGHSFEGFVLEQVIHSIPDFFDAFFYRTAAGAELDLLLIMGNRCRVGIEVKYSLAPRMSKSFRNAFEDVQVKLGLVVYPGEEIFPLDNAVFAYPVTRLPHLVDFFHEQGVL